MFKLSAARIARVESSLMTTRNRGLHAFCNIEGDATPQASRYHFLATFSISFTTNERIKSPMLCGRIGPWFARGTSCYSFCNKRTIRTDCQRTISSRKHRSSSLFLGRRLERRKKERKKKEKPRKCENDTKSLIVAEINESACVLGFAPSRSRRRDHRFGSAEVVANSRKVY